MKPLSDNWIVNNLRNAFETWNGKLTEIWQLVSQSPETFKGGVIWDIMVGINGALRAIGLALLVLFTAMSIFGGTMNFRDFKNWQTSFRFFLRFACAKVAITYAMDIMLAIFHICNGAVSKVAEHMGDMTANVTLPGEIETAIRSVGFLESIPLWLVTLIGSLVIWVLSILMILTVYGRFFKLFLYTAIAPIPLSSFAGEGTSSIGKAFVKSYAGVCMEGVVIVLCCIIFSAFAGADGPGSIDASLPAVNIVWNYVFEVIFNMLILVGLVKGSDRIVKEMISG